MKLALIGYGKMGKAIEEIALDRGHEVYLKITSQNTVDFNFENIKNCDVAIEFTGPDTATDNILKCLDYNIPVVSGSTGWLQNAEVVKAKCIEKNGAFLYASNFSIGVNIFFAVNEYLAGLMTNFPEYRPSILEIHHTGKKDSPSGTAISLAQQIINANDRLTGWVQEDDKENNILISSKREDPAPGTHRVNYVSTIDDIEIIHTAKSRIGFASGALKAAEFIAGKKGIFSMKDVLGF